MVMMVLTAFSSFYRFSTTYYYVGDGLSSLPTTINPMDALHYYLTVNGWRWRIPYRSRYGWWMMDARNDYDVVVICCDGDGYSRQIIGGNNKLLFPKRQSIDAS